jgi:NTP pyrophosphohydrolases containing a Zn-finger, probably nucleic-acid-binding
MSQNALPLWFVFHNKNLLLLLDKTAKDALPRGKERPFADPQGQDEPIHDLGTHDGVPCYAYALRTLPSDVEQQCAPTDLRSSYTVLGEPLYVIAGKGAELIHWDFQTRFCPACGAPTGKKLPISKECSACGNELFPNIAVAIIVLVRKGDKALLVRAHTFRGKNYGLVAGFLEPGETLEQCVAREVREETGLAVKNIRYFGSQPWPYPCGLMVGFTADYANGDLSLQEEELSAGAFFSRDALPDLPAKLSIARRIIDSWIEERA